MKNIKDFINESLKKCDDYVSLATEFINSIDNKVYKQYLNTSETNTKAKSMGLNDGEYACLTDFCEYCNENNYLSYDIKDSESNNAPEEWKDALYHLISNLYTTNNNWKK